MTEDKLPGTARATCTRSHAPTLLECVDISYLRGSTLGMPEIDLEARSDVSFKLETKVVRGKNETTPIWTPQQGLTGVWGKTSTILTQAAGAPRQRADGETRGVREFVERAGDVKCRPDCSAIETGLISLGGPPGCFAALRPRQMTSLPASDNT